MNTFTNINNNPVIRKAIKNLQAVLEEPILLLLLKNSNLTKAQLETILIDLVIEDIIGQNIPYENKAQMRMIKRSQNNGVSRGAFNRTLHQARRNITRSIYTLLLLAYLGLFEYSIFRPFEEVASKIQEYRNIREILAGKTMLSTEDIESYRAAEKVILSALEDLAHPQILK